MPAQRSPRVAVGASACVGRERTTWRRASQRPGSRDETADHRRYVVPRPGHCGGGAASRRHGDDLQPRQERAGRRRRRGAARRPGRRCRARPSSTGASSTASSTPAASCHASSGSRAARWPKSAGHYVFVSSISASGTWPGEVARDSDEGPPCASDAGPDDGDYGVLKAGCERAVSEVFGDRSTIARAGLILGPHENVGRLHLVAEPDGARRRGARAGRSRRSDAADRRARPGGVPARLDRRRTRPAPTTCPRPPATRRWAAGSATPPRPPARDAQLTWVDDDVLLAHEVEPWTELPLWMPPGAGRRPRVGRRHERRREDRPELPAGDARRCATPGPGCRPPTCSPTTRPGASVPGRAAATASTRTRSSASSRPGTPAERSVSRRAIRSSRIVATPSGSAQAAKCPPGWSAGASTTVQPRERATRAGPS